MTRRVASVPGRAGARSDRSSRTNRGAETTLLITVVCLVSAACSGEDPAGTRVSARDTRVSHRGSEVTVHIVENPAVSAAETIWRLVPEPVFSLGGSGVVEELSLFEVAGALRLTDGRIVVADGGSRTLKVFDPAGEFVRAAGGPGEGPGEFRALNHLARLPGDSVVMFDFGLRRLTVFDATFDLQRQVLIGSRPTAR